MKFLWEGKRSQGGRSLLDQIKQDTGLKYSGGVVSNQSSDLWGQGHDYKIITYGFSSFNDWYAESICPNIQVGSDYILVKYHCFFTKKASQFWKFIPIFLELYEKKYKH